MQDNEEQKKVDQAAYTIRLPKKVYKVRVKDAERKQTKEKNLPMDVLSLEIIDSEKVQDIDINGLEIKTQIVLTLKSLTFANPARSCFGLPALKNQEDIDNSNPKDYIGQDGYAIISTEEKEQKNDLTGEVLIDPWTGKKIVDFRRNVDQLIPRPAGK